MDVPTFDELMLIDLAGLPASDALSFLAFLVDSSFDQEDMAQRELGTVKALEWVEAINALDITDTQRINLDYFTANAWANRAGKALDPKEVWAWDNAPAQNQILFLRRALANPAFDEVEAVERCQILTNLGNCLNTVGRFVEAHEYWNRALAIEPQFWMALGNRGYGRIEYANAIYSQHNREQLIWAAYQDLTRAVAMVRENPYGSPGAMEFFQHQAEQLREGVGADFLTHEMQFIDYSLGRSNREKAYRRWALRETLFLNTLNDLGTYSAAAADPLHLPSFVVPLSEPPTLLGFFNQIKQEFVSARWLFFDGMYSDRPHFSDREVYLLNTLDYPAYGVGIERMKLAFRATYSIFDKIAFFLNAYLKLGIPEREVSFRGLWTVRKGGTVSLRPEFEGLENWPLRGLYWLSKDFFEKSFVDVTEPDARNLNGDRNHVEHKYFKVHDDLFGLLPETEPMFIDTLAHSMTRTELETKTLRLLKLTRAALIYLACGMSARERRLKAEKGDSTFVVSQGLPRFQQGRKT